VRRFVLAFAIMSAVVALGVGAWLRSSDNGGAPVVSKPAPAPVLGTIRGRILAVGGPVGGPRSWSHQPIRLVAVRSGRVVYAGRTDAAGRFAAHVPVGGYRLSLRPGLVVLRGKFGEVALDHYVVRVTDGGTIRPRVVVTNPLWA